MISFLHNQVPQLFLHYVDQVLERNIVLLADYRQNSCSSGRLSAKIRVVEYKFYFEAPDGSVTSRFGTNWGTGTFLSQRVNQ